MSEENLNDESLKNDETTEIPMDILYVNGDWAGKFEDGAVIDEEKQLFYNVNAFGDYAGANAAVQDGRTIAIVGSGIEVPSSVTDISYDVTVQDGAAMTVTGALTNTGTITADEKATIEVTGATANNGTLAVKGGSVFTANGVLSNGTTAALTIDNATVNYTNSAYIKNYGTVTLTNGASLNNEKASYHNYGLLKMYDSSLSVGGAFSLQSENGTYEFRNSTLAVNRFTNGLYFSETVTVLDNTTVNALGEVESRNGGTLSVTNGSVITANSWENTGKLTIDCNSTMIIIGNIENSGTITVDAAGFNSDYKKIIDANGLTGSSTISYTNLAEDVRVLRGLDDDIILTKYTMPTDTIYVNADWNGKYNTGDWIDEEKTLRYNINAFGNIADVAVSSNDVLIDVINGQSSISTGLTLSNDVIVRDSAELTFNDSYAVVMNCDFVVEAGGKIVYNATSSEYSNATSALQSANMYLNGTKDKRVSMTRNADNPACGIHWYVYGKSKINADYADIQLYRLDYLSSEGLTITNSNVNVWNDFNFYTSSKSEIKSSYLIVGALTNSGNMSLLEGTTIQCTSDGLNRNLYNNGTMTVDNSTVNAGTYLKNAASGVLTMSNGSSMSATTYLQNYGQWTLDASTLTTGTYVENYSGKTLSLSNKSSMNVGSYLGNYGTITETASSLEVKGNINNEPAGTININDKSSLTVGGYLLTFGKMNVSASNVHVKAEINNNSASGAISLSNGATMNTDKYLVNFGALTVNQSTVEAQEHIHNDKNGVIKLSLYSTLKAGAYLYNWNTVSIDGWSTAEIGTYVVNQSGKKLGVTNASTMTIGSYVENYGTVEVGASGKMTVNGAFTNTGTLWVDSFSTLTVKGEMTNSGTITIYAAGFKTGVRKVLELNGMTSGSKAVNVTSLNSGVYAVKGSDGDVMLADSSYFQTLRIDGSLAGKYTLGDVLDDTGRWIYGINVFSNLSDARNMTKTETTLYEFVGSTSENGISMELDKNVVNNGTIAVDASSLKTGMNLTNQEDASITLTNGSTLTTGQYLGNNGTINVDDSNVTANANIQNGKNSVLALSNGSTMNAGGRFNNYGTFTADSKSTVTVVGNTSNNGNLYLKGGSGLSTKGSLTNNGAIVVDAGSKLAFDAGTNVSSSTKLTMNSNASLALNGTADNRASLTRNATNTQGGFRLYMSYNSIFKADYADIQLSRLDQISTASQGFTVANSNINVWGDFHFNTNSNSEITASYAVVGALTNYGNLKLLEGTTIQCTSAGLNRNVTNYGTMTIDNSIVNAQTYLNNESSGKLVLSNGSSLTIGTYLQNNGQITIDGKSSVSVKSDSTNTGTIILSNGSSINFNSAKLTNNGTLKVTDSTVSAYSMSLDAVGATAEFTNSTLNVTGFFTNGNDILTHLSLDNSIFNYTSHQFFSSSGTITLTNGSVLNAAKSTVLLGNQTKLENSTLRADFIHFGSQTFQIIASKIYSGGLSNSGNITIDCASTLVFSGNSSKNTGTITVDATGFDSDYEKVVDANGCSELGTIAFTNLSDDTMSLLGLDGDVILTKYLAPTDTVYVNTDWDGKYNTGDWIDDEKTLRYNINAFGNIADVAVANKDVSIDILKGQNIVTEDHYCTIFNDVIVRDGSELAYLDTNCSIGEGVDIVVEAGGKLAYYTNSDSSDGYAVFQNSNLYLNGTEDKHANVTGDPENDGAYLHFLVEGTSKISSTYAEIKLAALRVTGTGNVSLANSTLETRDFEVHDESIVVMENTSIQTENFCSYGNVSFVNGTAINIDSMDEYAWWIENNGSMTVDSSSLTATREFHNDGELIIANSANIKVAKKPETEQEDDYQSWICFSNEWDAKLSVTGGSSFYSQFRFENYNAVTVDGTSTLTVDSTMNNDGTITVDGTSTLTVGNTMTNYGTIMVDGTSTLTVAGETTNTGTITVDASNFAGGYKKIVDLNGLAEGSNAVEVTGLADGIWAIYGDDGDVSLTDADLSVLKVSSDWVGEHTLGEYLDGQKWQYAINAFGEFDASLRNASDSSQLVDVVKGDHTTEGGYMSSNVTIRSGASLAAVENGSLEFTGTTLTVEGGAAVTGFQDIVIHEDAEMAMAGTAEQRASASCSILGIGAGGALNAQYADIDASTLELYGSATIGNSTLEATERIWGPGELAVSASTVAAGKMESGKGNLALLEGSSMTLTAGMQIDNMMIDNASSLAIGEDVEAGGSVIVVNASTLEADGAMNAGSVDISGKSSLTLGGDLNVAAGERLSITENSNAVVEGNLNLGGEATMIQGSTLAVVGDIANASDIQADASAITAASLDSGTGVVDLFNGTEMTLTNGLAAGEVGIGNKSSLKVGADVELSDGMYVNYNSAAKIGGSVTGTTVDVHETSSLNVGGDVTLSEGGYLNIEEKSTVVVDGSLEYVNLAVIRDASRLEVAQGITGNSQFSVEAATVMAASLDVVNGYVDVYDGAEMTLTGGMTSCIVTVECAASLNVGGGMTLEDGGCLCIADKSSVAVVGDLLLDENTEEWDSGAIMLDATSTLTVAGNTTLSHFQVDAAGFDGAYVKLADLNGISTETYTYTAENHEAGVHDLHYLDGDVALTNADLSELQVSEDWAGAFEDGAAIAEESAFLYNVNAYGNINEAFNAATHVGEDVKHIHILAGDMTLTTKTPSNWTKDLTIESGASLTYDTLNFVNGMDGVTVTLNGAAGLFSVEHIVLSENSSLTMAGEEDARGTLEAADKLDLEANASLTADHADISADIMGLEDTATVALDNTTLTLADTLVIAGAMTADNASSLYVGSDVYMYDGAELAVTGDSDLTADGTLENNGAITLDATATLAVAGATTNAGSITLDATGFTDTYRKVVDLNGLDGNDIKAINLESGVNAIQKLDGDVALTSADISLLKVNAAWNGKYADGEAIDEDFLYNANAYGDIDEAANTAVRVDDVKKVQILSGSMKLTQQMAEWKDDLAIENGASLSYDGSLAFGSADVDLTGSASLALDSASFGGNLDLAGTSSQRSKLTADGALALTGKAALDADYAAIAAGSVSIASGATVDLNNTTVTVDGALANSGAISMNLTSAITAGSFSGKSGSITVDMTGASQQMYTLVDVTGDSAMTLANFGKVTLSSKEYEAVVNGNDLAAACIGVIKVNNAWTADSVLPDGYFWNVNAFSTLDAATAKVGWGKRTYEIVRDVDSRMTLSVSMDKGTASVSISEKGGSSISSFLVAGSKKQVVEMEAGKTYEIVMSGSNLEYDFSTSFQDVVLNCDKTITITEDNTSVTEKGHVGYGSGAQNYTFSVGTENSGSYTFTFSTNDDRISYTVSQVVDGTTAKTLVSGSTTGSATRTLNLTKGNYVATVNSYDNGAGAYESYFTMQVDAEIANDVSSADDKPILNDTTGSLKTLSLDSSETSGFVGYGDKTDYIAIDTQNQNGTYSFELDVAEGTSAKGLKFVLVQYDGKKETTVKSVSFAGSKATISNVILDRTKNYFLKLDVASASTTSKNATYTLKMSGTVAATNTRLSSDDDKWNSDYVQNNAFTGGTYENWVGTEDRLDYVKLDLSKGSKTLRFLTNDSKRVAVTIYQLKSGKSTLSTLKSLNMYTGKAVDYKLIVAANTEYYVRFQSVAGTNVSSNYSMALA